MLTRMIFYGTQREILIFVSMSDAVLIKIIHVLELFTQFFIVLRVSLVFSALLLVFNAFSLFLVHHHYFQRICAFSNCSSFSYAFSVVSSALPRFVQCICNAFGATVTFRPSRALLHSIIASSLSSHFLYCN